MKKISGKICAMMLSASLTLSYAPAVFAAETDGNSAGNEYSGWDTIKVFETTDVHGYITDVSSYKEDTFEYRLAYISKIVKEARSNPEEYDDVLLLDSGDIYQGTPHSNLTYGAALRAAFDEMDYDAVGLGNHEFDWDVKKYAADEKGTMAPYKIGNYEGDSDIPILMSNLYYKDSGKRVEFTKDYTVVEKAGYRVAIIGWADDYSADIKASQIAPYTIDGDMNKLKEHAAEIKEKEHADITIILTHSDPKAVADAMDPEVVDLVAGGHTHKSVNGTSDNGIDYMQGNCYGYGYSTTEIKVNPKNKEVEVVTPEYKEISPKGKDHSYLYYDNGSNDRLDPEVAKISQAAWNAVKGEMYEVLGTTEQSITRSFIDEKNGTSSIAGNWLAGLMLDATKGQKTVAAFANRGGIRANLELAQGAKNREITVADIYTISPFGNRILTFSITGKQMAKQLETALIGLNPSIGIDSTDGYNASNYGDQFAGITATYKLADGGIKILSIKTDDGQMIDINDSVKTYNVCVNEYCATLPNSVFKGMTPIVAMDEAPVDNLSTIEALRARRDASDGMLKLDTTAHTMTLENTTASLTDALEKYDGKKLSEEEQAEITSMKKEIHALLVSGGLSTEEHAVFQKLEEKAENLLSEQKENTDKKEEESKLPEEEAKKPGVPVSGDTGKNNMETPEKGVTEVQKQAPKTGDTNSSMPWIVLLFVSGAGIAGAAVISRKKENRG